MTFFFQVETRNFSNFRGGFSFFFGPEFVIVGVVNILISLIYNGEGVIFLESLLYILEINEIL